MIHVNAMTLTQIGMRSVCGSSTSTTDASTQRKAARGIW